MCFFKDAGGKPTRCGLCAPSRIQIDSQAEGLFYSFGERDTRTHPRDPGLLPPSRPTHGIKTMEAKPGFSEQNKTTQPWAKQPFGRRMQKRIYYIHLHSEAPSIQSLPQYMHPHCILGGGGGDRGGQAHICSKPRAASVLHHSERESILQNWTIKNIHTQCNGGVDGWNFCGEGEPPKPTPFHPLGLHPPGRKACRPPNHPHTHTPGVIFFSPLRNPTWGGGSGKQWGERERLRCIANGAKGRGRAAHPPLQRRTGGLMGGSPGGERRGRASFLGRAPF